MAPNIEVKIIQEGEVFYPFYLTTDHYYATGGKIGTINSGDIVEMRQIPVQAILTAQPQQPGLVPTITATRIKLLAGYYMVLNYTEKELAEVIRAAS